MKKQDSPKYDVATMRRGPTSQPRSVVTRSAGGKLTPMYEIPAASGRDAAQEAAEIKRETRGYKAGGQVKVGKTATPYAPKK